MYLNKIASRIIVFFLTIIIILIIIRYKANSGRQQTIKELLGTYVLDISKTKLEDCYIKDSNIYKNLSITFFKNSTFKMNMNVPFMYNSIGKYKSGNVNEWCWLLFDKFKYDIKNKNSGSQFTRPYKINSDTFILINAATPKENEKTISEIYFRKIKSQ